MFETKLQETFVWRFRGPVCLEGSKENLWQTGGMPQCYVLWHGRGILHGHPS